ncbi:Crp/Fnr family transcriptional regulator [Aequorivita marina]|uniref:Crp/Fnr family transcriptional regulator n=1 Tax=Aequorivita marina TaxID=3073654 RepID=UPI0028766CB6|nr:Crp/Fnr family transcriptional regulator [Aequorivita sp. S2608]MDS1299423.1 Crp/Fnr family transcriptional regulator [Aequorivita sp. S2608]
MKIDQILDNIYPLPETSRELLKQHITEVAFSKGHLLLKADKLERNIYFIKKGIARIYTHTTENEITFLFCKEGSALVSMRSYVENKSGYENVELLEDSQLYELKAEKLQNLFIEDIHIANWARKFAEQELIKTEERFISRQFRTAKERYNQLLNENPELIQRVQLGHIASYLGITQVSLSRIRAAVK